MENLHKKLSLSENSSDISELKKKHQKVTNLLDSLNMDLKAETEFIHSQ